MDYATDIQNIQPGSPVILRGVRVLDPFLSVDQKGDLLVARESVTLEPAYIPPYTQVVNASGLIAMPGLIDMHVHLREPGQTHKETWATGSKAALAGGITTVVVMPNTAPALDSPQSVLAQQTGMRAAEGVDLWVAAAATIGLEGKQKTDILGLKKAGAVAITDDGKPVLDNDVMRQVLVACKAADVIMMQHAEDTRLSRHAPVHLGKASAYLQIPGQPGASEFALVERDIHLVRQIGARYHVLHVSTAQTVALVKAAKRENLQVSCEVTPHHLWLTEEACLRGDANTKMNPPLRTDADKQALIEGVVDGTIEAVASDHAPHATHEKAQGMCQAPFGVVGLETAFCVLYSLVHQGIISALKAVELMNMGPARILQQELTCYSLLHPNSLRHVAVFDPEQIWTVSEKTLKGKSVNSAFLGKPLRGLVKATFLRGELRYLATKE